MTARLFDFRRSLGEHIALGNPCQPGFFDALWRLDFLIGGLP